MLIFWGEINKQNQPGSGFQFDSPFAVVRVLVYVYGTASCMHIFKSVSFSKTKQCDA